jgi:hypothetical protein
MLVQFLREKPGDDIEVFVVMRGEPMSVLLGQSGRTARRRQVPGDFEFVRSKHGSQAA